MMNKPNNSRTLENGTKMITTNGAKNRSNMKIVLTIICSFPYLLNLLFLKYSDTRLFSVEEKSGPTDLAKVSFLIKIELI
ncbi:hypothetical protein CQA01_30580 [Cyclobacterium qasimii]|uniref:Uncharacterized protein n=1 Tax=Cyclobacterium qasimii TaxID=1350429 RepID=A0A512CE89_9BACT|nr:hypothetical protein CQA01_30580 [Cyclobacterium qasimii]